MRASASEKDYFLDDAFKNPAIIITSPEDSDTCRWVSVGWRTIVNYRSRKSEELFREAVKAIDAAANILDAKVKLEEAGFTVTTDPNYWEK